MVEEFQLYWPDERRKRFDGTLVDVWEQAAERGGVVAVGWYIKEGFERAWHENSLDTEAIQ